MSNIAFHNITDQTITFFGKGRPWSVGSDHPKFGEVRRRRGQYENEWVDNEAVKDVYPA